jgi:DNA-binding MarR family transcriptional regulator
MRAGKGQGGVPGITGVAGDRPISALLSQVLVAFTIELDNEFERRMADAGHPGALLSLVVWSNLMRFLAEGQVSVRELAAQALASEKRVKFELGCLERWGFVMLQADPMDDRPIPTRAHRRASRILRDGWGSGRGVRSGWMVRLTDKGRKASEIWPPLFGEIERRWQARFGSDEIVCLREALEDILEQVDLEPPQGLPGHWDVVEAYSAREARRTGTLPLPVLLSQLLLAFTIEFDRESRAPLKLCANTLRVLGERPIPVGDIPRLTGGSPETSGIGWQIKPYIVVEPDPTAGRGKVVRLTPLGLKAQRTYRELVGEIEKRWEARFGTNKIRRLRDALRELFVPRSGDRLLLSEGLVPAEGTVRAAEQAPALGRQDIGAAARQRMRDLVAQTEMFLRDPARSLTA